MRHYHLALLRETDTMPEEGTRVFLLSLHVMCKKILSKSLLIRVVVQRVLLDAK
jgi:hypothetical protein